MRTRTLSPGAAWIVGALALVWAGPTAAQQGEILIRGGTVVNATGQARADVRIRNGVIAEIGPGLTAAQGVRVIDATGKLLLPGGIDPHVHMTLERTANTGPGADDFASASRAALSGGITTIGTFIDQNPNESPQATLAHAIEVASKQVIADGLLHFTVSDPTKMTPADVQFCATRGST
jgi:dihydropyrimidinase